MGGKLLGWRTVCAVEINAYCRRVLLARQRDGILDPFPIWDDVRTFDGKPWRGSVDVVSGGFPCQDISTCGKGAGINGAKSGLWREQSRIISEVRPRFVFVENSPALTFRGLGNVLGDLAGMGYDARWGVIGASDAGKCHRRRRIWIVADSDRKGLYRAHDYKEIPWWFLPSASERVQEDVRAHRAMLSTAYFQRKRDGVANWMDRLRCIGNGQVPAVVQLAWAILQRAVT